MCGLTTIFTKLFTLYSGALTYEFNLFCDQAHNLVCSYVN